MFDAVGFDRRRQQPFRYMPKECISSIFLLSIFVFCFTSGAVTKLDEKEADKKVFQFFCLLRGQCETKVQVLQTKETDIV